MIRRLALVTAALLVACAAPPALLQTSETIAEEASPVTAPATSIPLDRLFASPSLSGPTAREVKYSPDGSRVSFLRSRTEDTSRFDLWAFDVATGEASMLVDSTLLEPEDVELSEEEKAIRERKRIAGSRGIVAYDWGGPDRLLVPIGGDLWLVTLGAEGAQTRQLTDTEGFEYDARVSPGGRYVSFVRGGAVYAIELETSEERRLTPEAEPEKAISYGVAEFVAQEEMSRYTGYWWSPDDQFVAYTRVDESTVDIIPRFEIAAGETTVIEQRYPRAGRPNAVVDLFIAGVEDSASVKLLSVGPDTYLADASWIGDDALLVHRVDRDQTETLASVHSTVGGEAMLDAATERQERWINLFHDGVTRDAEGGLIFTSERSGHRHIWRMDEDGEAKPVTSGDWDVSAKGPVVGDTVFFTGYMDTPLERHLYRYSWTETSEPYEPVLLTERGKSWSVSVAPDGKSFVGTSSAPNQPPQTGLYSMDGERIAWIEKNALDTDHPYAPYLDAHTVPEFGTIEAEDGQEMHYSIQLPPDFDPAKRYPVLVNVYGGPGVQTVNRDWERLTDVFYTQQGYIVFRLDNRGSANRGKAFEDVIYRQMGIPEVRDQLLGVEWLKFQPFVDAERIGIQGWSYGGYMTLMTMLQAEPGTFAAAVSGAPVTDWSLYDTFYTERYMDTPQDNPDGYERGSVFYHLDRFEGEMNPLLLIHGMADDNVTFDNTTRLMAALQEQGRPFELMTYPGQRHGIRGEALSKHLMQTRMDFLDRHLKAEEE
ncbi:MAG: S9 family peptidase [Pseudomonadota bacterium]